MSLRHQSFYLLLFIFLWAGQVLADGAPLSAFDNGVLNYKARNFQAAINFFSSDIAGNPDHAPAYMYRANSYYLLGQYALALQDFQKVQILRPNPQVAAFIARLQQWLSAHGMTPSKPVRASTALKKEKPGEGISVRVYGNQGWFTPTDFITDMNTNKANTAHYALTDTSATFYSMYPTSDGAAVVEPCYRFDSHFEVGMPIASVASVPVSESQYSNSLGPINTVYNLSAMSLGLNARYILGNGEFAFEFSGGPRFVPITMQYTSTTNSATYTSSATSLGIGLQAQFGIDWQLFTGVVISPLIGYQLVSASGFHSTITGGGLNLTGTWEMVPGSQGTAIGLVQDGTSAPSGSRPLVIDFSGMTFGGQLAIYF